MHLTLYRRLIALAAIVVFVAQAAAQQVPEPQPIIPASVEVGQPFPLVMLPRMDTGQPDTLVNYRGQKLIMHIFASW